jgi:hypothetical protein
MSAAEQINFSSLMEPVVARLLGEPNQRLSKPPKDIRYGTHGSLAVDLSHGVFFDHENQRGGGVFELVASQLGCDREGAIDWLRQEGLLPEPQQGSSIAAVYEYRDEDRTLLFQVCRFEPKDFRPRRPDGRYTLEGVRRVLYRLPDVLKATPRARRSTSSRVRKMPTTSTSLVSQRPRMPVAPTSGAASTANHCAGLMSF